MAKETYGRDSYAAYLGRQIDPEEIRKAQEDEARKAALKLSDLEAYYRQWVEDHLYNRQNVYTDPTLTQDDLARLTQMDSDDFNRFFNAYLLILQEQGIDVNDPDSFMDAQQRTLNGIDRQLAELENASRDGDWQTKYDELIRQRQAAEDLYNKAQGIWQYVDDARAKGWTPDAVGDSGADFSAIDGSRAGRQYREERMAEGFGSGGDLSGLWLPEQKEKKPRAYNGGIINGVYVPAGTYTEEEWQAAITSPYNRVGEDGLTDGQRLIQQQQKRKEEAQKRKEEEQARRTQEMLAGLITSTDPATGNASDRNMTKAWITNNEHVQTRVANDPTMYKYGGKIPTAEPGANTSADAVMAALASAETAASSGSGRSSAGRAGGTGLSDKEKAQYGRDAYTSMLDAMARGMANTGGMTNTAALQAANAVYDAYAKEPELKGAAESAYSRYLGDSSSRAGERRYTWLNRAQNGGYGTTMPQTSVPAGTQTSTAVSAAPADNPGAVTPTMPTVGKRPAWQQGGQNIRDTIAGLLARKYAGTGGERNREDIYTRLSRLIRR